MDRKGVDGGGQKQWGWGEGWIEEGWIEEGWIEEGRRNGGGGGKETEREREGERRGREGKRDNDQKCIAGNNNTTVLT